MKTFNFKAYSKKLKAKFPHLSVEDEISVEDSRMYLHTCSKHGSFYKQPRTLLLKNNRHGCNSCGKEAVGNALQKPPLEYLSQLKERHPHINLKSSDIVRKKVYLFDCIKHGEFESTMYALLREKNLFGCPACGYEAIGDALRKPISVHQDELNLSNSRVKCLNLEYLGSGKIHTYKCLDCDATFENTPGNIKYQRLQACPTCRLGDRNIHTYKDHLALRVNLILLGEYKTWSTPIPHKCTEHNTKFNISPNAVVLGRNRCPKCAMNSTQRYRRKVICTRGKTFTVQGYEEQGLQYLLNNCKLRINQVSNTNVPTISYLWHGDRKYYADFFVKSRQLLVEVKSSYTLGVKNLLLFNRNKKKALACSNSGFDILFLVAKANGSVVELPGDWIHKGVNYTRNYLKFNL